MTTLSQMVDDIIIETRRTNMVVEITSYVNQVIREMYTNPAGMAKVMYWSDMKELQVVADTEERFVWAMPKLHLFQDIEAVFYQSVSRYAAKGYPSSVHRNESSDFPAEYWYRTGDSLAFAGYGGIGGLIDLAWFEYLPGLIYYPESSPRPATWDTLTQSFSYGAGYAADDTSLDLVTNWMLRRHGETIKQGVKAKVYARLANVDRQRTYYAMYMSMRVQMISAETYESGVRV